VPELRRAGVIDEIRRRGMSPTSVCWRRWEDHSAITGIDGASMADVDGEDLRMACLVLDQLDELMLEEFLAKYDGKVHWRHKVVRAEQDEEQKKAWIDVETPEGSKRFYGDYVIGCDGATSQVRKSLFGDEYPGFTWERNIVATNVSWGHDFACKR
jgi:2-polyprenyl-6-methoxyphenol hydroxylase-like FAD-dependent oxidoreductase